jgi:diguanylate cyclase (GGDEF)-like protein
VPDDDFEPDEEHTAIFNSADLEGAIAAPSTRRLHVLIRMDGSDVGRVFTLSDPEVGVGRLPENGLQLPDEGISRKHARFVYAGETYMIEDLKSANGTFVSGGRVTTHILRDTDVVQFGPRVVFRYSVADASEEQMLRQLYEASVKDSLTGAYNREYLGERLKAEVAFSKRHKTELGFVLFDIDHFKKVNDTHGHQAGDAVLIELVKVLKKALRTEDVVARYGGEEFAITLRGIGLEGAARVGERIRLAVEAAPIQYEDLSIPITISVGVATLKDCEDPGIDPLIGIADRRLYAAKRGGRNRVIFKD